MAILLPGVLQPMHRRLEGANTLGEGICGQVYQLGASSQVPSRETKALNIAPVLSAFTLRRCGKIGLVKERENKD